MELNATFICELACQRALTVLIHHLDHGEYQRAAAQFAPDATWVRHGKTLTGTAEILAAISVRPVGQVQRHVVSNVLVTQTAPDQATATAYLTLYRTQTDNPDIRLPVEMIGVDGVGEYATSFCCIDGVWLISAHDGWPVMLTKREK